MQISLGNFNLMQMQHTVEKVTGFDLNTLWQLSFGYKGLPFPAAILNSLAPGFNAPGRKQQMRSQITGSPYYHKLKNGQLAFMPIWLDNKLLPITRISISRRKIIKETSITGRMGSVKEIIRSDDYNITIQGLAFGENRNFPEEEVYMLKQLADQNRSLNIRSVITDLFLEEKDQVVITDINFPAARSEHVQPWEIKLLSDEVFDLYMDNNS